MSSKPELRLIETGSPLHARDRARLDIQKYYFATKWTVLPSKPSNVDSVLKRATREPDPQVPTENWFLKHWRIILFLLVVGLIIYGTIDYFR